MRRTIAFLWAAVLTARLAVSASADTVQTIDLSRFVGHTPVVKMDADWQVPHGRQVLDGVPFQIDGSLLLHGNNPAQKQTPGRTNANDILVGRKFERLHLLGGSDTAGKDGIAVAKVRLLYADGSDAVLELKYGKDLRSWTAPWHKEEAPLRGTNARVVWTGQNSQAGQSDRYLRLYHTILANPSPDKEVRTLSLESAGTQYGLLLLAASVGPAAADRLPDTVTPAKSPFPDLRRRNGELVRGEGFLKGMDGKPIAGGLVRVTAAREFNKPNGLFTTHATGVGSGVETDATGHFTLPPLPDNRLYRVLAVGEGFDSKTYGGLDPKSDPFEIRLKPLAAHAGDRLFSLRAKVLGPDGKPLAYAIVEPEGVGNKDDTSWGDSEGFTSRTLTGTNGEFILARTEPFDRLQVKITVPGLAQTILWLQVSNATQTVQVGVGAIMRGRVLLGDKPLAGVRVGVSGQERNMESYRGHFEETTGTNGDFVFEHLPPDTAWHFYGFMDSFKTYGALPSRLVQTSGHGEVTELGDLKVIPALHLAGLVKTRHGEPLPKNLKVTLSYSGPWDNQTVNVDNEGQFRFEGLAAAQVQVFLDNRNWHLSCANRNLESWNASSVVGRLEQDKDDLWLMIEKGARNENYFNSANGQLPAADQPGQRPIFGVEPTGPPMITLAGKVVDNDTGGQVMSFQISPGYKPPSFNVAQPQKSLLDRLLNPGGRKMVPWNERICWLFAEKESVTNGSFSVDFPLLSSQPVLLIEAAGYAPFQTQPTNTSVTNLVLRLKKGVGPNGVVLLPNGQHAAGATVVYAVAEEQFDLEGTSLSSYGDTNATKVTAQDGKFSFAPRMEGITLFVSHPAGWAEKSVERGGVENLQIELQPWCTVTGILVDSNNVPAAGITLELTRFHDWQNGGALVNLNGEAVTDAGGKFTFTNTPPGRLELQRMAPVKLPGGGAGRGTTYQMQTPVVARPGTVNDLGKVTMDHPPPDSMMDSIKSRLGL